MIARLKLKCSTTLISLLEARNNDDIVLRMMKSVQVDLIKRNISDIYLQFKELYENYSNDVFRHVNFNNLISLSYLV